MIDAPRVALRGRRPLAIAAMALPILLAPVSCALAPVPASAPATTLSPVVTTELLAAHAELLRLEDRRELDLPALAMLTASADARVRARTAIALARLRDPAGADLLATLLEDPDTSVAATAAFALGQLGDSTSTPLLVGRLETDDDPTVAAEAAYALGKVGGAQARAALEALLTSTAAENRAAAPVVGSALLAIWKLPLLDDRDAVSRWLQVADPELRWRAALALARGAVPRALPALRRALRDPDARVRAQAARGLTSAAADSAGVAAGLMVPELSSALDDADYAVRINAARSLGGYSDPAAVRALATAVTSPRPHLALAAVEALGRIGPAAASAAGVLRSRVQDAGAAVAIRAAALEGLARIDAAAAQPLSETHASSGEWRLRVAAARSRATIGGPRDLRLLELLRDPDARVAAAALQAAVEASGDTLEPLRPLLLERLGAADPIVRSTALGALAGIPQRSLLPALLDAYGRAQRDPLNDAALAALDALGALPTEGSPPERAFLARYGRPADPLVHLRAMQRLDSLAVLRAWGEPYPIGTGGSAGEYQRLVERLIHPDLAGDPPPEVKVVTRGDTMTIRLFASHAPLTVQSFLSLADSGFFDGQEWPRVVPGFVVQGGDPRGDTSGGPGYSIRDEINRRRYASGTVGMALAGPDTGGSQFFATHTPQPHLDGTYTVFGEVVEGGELLQEILPGDVIETIRSVR